MPSGSTVQGKPPPHLEEAPLPGLLQTKGAVGAFVFVQTPSCLCGTRSPTKRASLVAQRVKNLPAMQVTQFDPLVGKIFWRSE